MIIVSPAGGICNRITALEASYHLSKRLNSRCLVLWHLRDELNCNFQELFYKPKRMIVISSKRGYKIERFLRWLCKGLGKRAFYYDFNNNYFNKQCKKDIDNAFNEQTNEKFDEMFLKEKLIFLKDPYYSFYGSLSYDVIKANPRLDDIANSILGKEKRYIGVHIRGTDHIACKQHVKVNLYIEKVRSELARNKELSVYLATDEKDVREQFAIEFGDRVVYNDGTIFNRTTKNGVIGGLIDLLCLSKTEKIYGSYASTFSLYAASINHTPMEICVNGVWGKYKYKVLDNLEYMREEYIDFESTLQGKD